MLHPSHSEWRTIVWVAWSAIAVGIIVLLFYTDTLPAWNSAIAEQLTLPPFCLDDASLHASPTLRFGIACGVTLLTAWTTARLAQWWQFLVLLPIFLLITALFTPVLGIWGIQYNTLAALLAISIATTGVWCTLLIMRHARTKRKMV